jgi:signal transduction histidine kinase
LPDEEKSIVLTGSAFVPPSKECPLATAQAELQCLSRQLALAQENERSRIARELHDDVQQILVGLRMSMESTGKMPATSTFGDDIRTWVSWVQRAIDHLHELTVTLRKPGIGSDGLASELRAHVSHLTLQDGQVIELELDPGVGQLAPEIELACFRIVQEGLANAVKHSKAGHLQVSLKKCDHGLSVSIDDDGIGFDVPIARERALKTGGIGLLSMKERAALVGGRLEVRSSIGHGTQVRGLFSTSLPVS